MSKRQILLLIYRHFLTKLNEEYKSLDRDRDLITSFLLTLHLRYNLRLISSRYLFDYISNQFNYRESTVTDFGKYSIQNVFGKSSLERYMNDSRKYEFNYVVTHFLTRHNIKYTQIFKPKLNLLKLGGGINRKRFHNTPAGLLLCVESTSLYDEECEECITCKFIETCKEIKNREK